MAQHIQTPEEGYTGKVGAVHFANGVAHTDNPAELAYFGRHGYDIAESCPPDCPAAPAPELTPKQKLQAEAKSLGLSEEGTKDELEARIAEHKAKAAGGGTQEKEATK